MYKPTCNALTLKKVQCKRKAKFNGKCAQHADNLPQIFLMMPTLKYGTIPIWNTEGMMQIVNNDESSGKRHFYSSDRWTSVFYYRKTKNRIIRNLRDLMENGLFDEKIKIEAHARESDRCSICEVQGTAFRFNYKYKLYQLCNTCNASFGNQELTFDGFNELYRTNNCDVSYKGSSRIVTYRKPKVTHIIDAVQRSRTSAYTYIFYRTTLETSVHFNYPSIINLCFFEYDNYCEYCDTWIKYQGCSDCNNYALKELVNRNYPRYLLIKNLNLVMDINKIIIRFFLRNCLKK